MMLELRFLGEMEVLRDGTPVALPPSRKTRALLAYLALSGRPQRREHLVSMFWDIPDDPRGALRWSLSKLRPLVDEPHTPRITTAGDSVAFDTSTALIDILDIRNTIGTNITAQPNESLVALEAAFRGDLLDGLELPDCHEFDAWRMAEREEARRLHANILKALIGRLSSEPEEALGYARKLLRIGPFDPDGHASLCRLLHATERHEEAAHQKERSALLLKEVGREAPDAFQAALAATDRDIDSSPANERADSELHSPAVRVTRTAREQEIRFCEAPDGVQLAYATVGTGPPIVKAPNWMSHLEYEWESPVWRHWLGDLSRENQLIRYDERGNGLSDWNVEEISFDSSLRDLEAVVDTAGLDRFSLLGISQGCAISVAYAARHPERVEKLVLYGGYARGWKKRSTPEAMERNNALLALMKHGWGQENPAFRQLFTSLFMPDASHEQMAWFNDLQRLTTSPDNAVRIRSVRGDADITPLLPQIKMPTLVFHCLSDAMVPFAEGRYLAMKIPNSRFVPLDSRNHLILENEPAWPRFVYELRRFLAPDTTR